MEYSLTSAFYWHTTEGEGDQAPSERYRQLVDWAAKARGKNPDAFDQVTKWLLDESAWGSGQMESNERVLMQEIIGRFQAQTRRLRELLTALSAEGVVNGAVFDALDRFDRALSGQGDFGEKSVGEAVSRMFSDFSCMGEAPVRKRIAGAVTGPAGNWGVDLYGYVNHLKDCDAGVQWTLFMPDTVKNQQNGFKLERIEFRKMPAMRFIGLEEKRVETDPEACRKLFETLSSMKEYQSEFSYDLFFIHHYGLTVDIGPGYGFWGAVYAGGYPGSGGVCLL